MKFWLSVVREKKLTDPATNSYNSSGLPAHTNVMRNTL